MSELLGKLSMLSNLSVDFGSVVNDRDELFESFKKLSVSGQNLFDWGSTLNEQEQAFLCDFMRDYIEFTNNYTSLNSSLIHFISRFTNELSILTNEAQNILESNK